jgi:NAD(P)-dependent dehydrogenase (short-subunit alcohol dehydrogenase family)
MPPSRLLLITGVSSGFGRALAQQALLAGHRVVGTVRNETDRQVRSWRPAAHSVACWT